jgi:hypothetical protein
MRNVVDGDTWFFVKCIADRGRLGFGKYNSYNIKIYATASGGGGVKYNTACSATVILDHQQATELLKHLKDCHERSKLITKNDWGGKGTYISRNIETEYGTNVDIMSYGDGMVWFSILNTDRLGVRYMISANELQFMLTTEGYKEVIGHLETELGKITDQEKMWGLEAKLKREQERALIHKTVVAESEGKWYVDKGTTVEDLLKRINSYMLNFDADPGNVELTLEYLENWEVEGPKIILKPK